MSKRKICVVTGTRAEYGLLYWLMKEIQDDPDLDLQVIATGAHLSPEFGETYKDIESDGFHIDWKVDMLLSGDSSVAVTKSLGLAMVGFADAYYHLKPDVVVILGDRYEMLGAVQSAFLSRIPIAHIHGGEVTIGAYDDCIRHAITKMSNFHFVAHDDYKKRVIQLGEDPENVFVTGPACIDPIRRNIFLSKEDLEKELGIILRFPLFLVTFHPETTSAIAVEAQISPLLEVLSGYKEATVLCTGSNADIGGRHISSEMASFCSSSARRFFFDNLGKILYPSLMRISTLVIGNSSSGILEAPILGVPSVNIGDRQKGRIKDILVVDSKNSKTSISEAIEVALRKKRAGQNSSLLKTSSPASFIKNILSQKTTSKPKVFYDL